MFVTRRVTLRCRGCGPAAAGGAGVVSAAAIASGAVPVVDLREVFRQAQGSAIVKAAHAVHSGTMPPLTRTAPSQPSQVTLRHCTVAFSLPRLQESSPNPTSSNCHLFHSMLFSF